MRWLARSLVALALLLALALGAGSLWLSRTLDGPALRARIDRDAEAILGRRVGFADLGFRLLPPALVVREPFVAAPDPDAPPFLRAGSVVIAVELLPLLDRQVAIRRLSILDGKVRLVRRVAGIELPVRQARETSDEDDGFRLSLRQVVLEDAQLHFEDRLFDPPVSWTLDDVDAELDVHGPGVPLELVARVESEGGTLEVEGSVLPGERVDLQATLDRFPLTPARQVLPEAFRLDGRATGTGRLQGPPAAPERLEIDLRIDDTEARHGTLSLDGRVAVRAAAHGDLRSPTGVFDIDASAARARWGELLTKASGAYLRASGSFRKREGQPFHVEGELEMNQARYALEARFGPRVRVRLVAAAFELRHWHPMLNVFSELELSGPVQSDRLEILTDPLEIRGEARLGGVEVTLPDGARVSFTGAFVADGQTLRTREVVLRGEAGEVPLDAEVTSFEGDWPFRLRFAGQGLDTNALLTHVAGRPDLLTGPLDIDADLRGRLAGETSLRDALAGRVSLRIAPGSLRGISILEATFRTQDESRVRGFFRRLKQPIPRRSASAGLSRYYGDSFDVLSATLDLKRGTAHTQDFLLKTPFYAWEMQGAIRLEDMGLDARGQLTLGRELVGSIAGNVDMPGPGLPGVAIPLPAIRGTLTDPQVEADWGHFWGTLATNVPGVRLLRRLGKKLPTF